jgi:hypothetical protein
MKRTDVSNDGVSKEVVVDDTTQRTHARLAPVRIGGGRSGSHKPKKGHERQVFLHLNHLATYHYTRKAWSVIEPVTYVYW